MNDPAGNIATFSVIFIALYIGHTVGDHWVQTSAQAAGKGLPGAEGRRWCALHVTTLALTQLAAITAVWVVVLDQGALNWPFVDLALLVNAASHYWADRRTTLAGLCDRLGKGGFYRLGAPRPGRDDNPSLGTGAYALDQAWHMGWLFIAAIIATI